MHVTAVAVQIILIMCNFSYNEWPQATTLGPQKRASHLVLECKRLYHSLVDGPHLFRTLGFSDAYFTKVGAGHCHLVHTRSVHAQILEFHGESERVHSAPTRKGGKMAFLQSSIPRLGSENQIRIG